MLKALGENTESQDLGLGHGLICGGAIGKYARQLGHFRQPAPILFALTLNIEVHGQLPGSDFRTLRLAPFRCLTKCVPQTRLRETGRFGRDCRPDFVIWDRGRPSERPGESGFLIANGGRKARFGGGGSAGFAARSGPLRAPSRALRQRYWASALRLGESRRGFPWPAAAVRRRGRAG